MFAVRQESPNAKQRDSLKGQTNMSDYGTDQQRQSTSQSHLPRRLKACVCCRELKLRCKRNDERPEDGCERCINARRQCIAPEPAKRRPKVPRKNVSSSVASLESKLDALAAALDERRGVNQERQLGDMIMEPELGQLSVLSE
jgi:hypothetical protein